jgi:hypothetical protein
MRISESMRNMVIKDWLKGNHRDKIAVQTGLSGGTITLLENGEIAWAIMKSRK